MKRPGRAPRLATLLLAGVLAVGVWVWEGYGPRRSKTHRGQAHGQPPARLPVVAATPSPTASPPGVQVEATPTPAVGAARERLAVIVAAVAAQSDPAKLATLGSRGANPRLKKIVFYLAQGRDAGADPLAIIRAAQRANGSTGTPRAALVEASC